MEHTTLPSHTSQNKTFFGFWLYLMTDLIMFSVFFAVYAVLHKNTFGGPSAAELFSLPFVLIETIILLTSSFTSGIGMLGIHRNNTKQVVIFFLITFILGLTFIGMELYEFSKLLAEGQSWQKSAFLSSFFTLVGAHGLHITGGLIWLTLLLINLKRKGLTRNVSQKFTLLSIFWHFLDIVWIFIFTLVYLLGGIGV